MKISIIITACLFLLTGCAELRTIGSAAIQELHADAVAVNWSKSQRIENVEKRRVVMAANTLRKPANFSSFSRTQVSMLKPVKGKWE